MTKTSLPSSCVARHPESQAARTVGQRMLSRSVFLSLAVVLVGCFGDAEAPLVGKWVSTPDFTIPAASDLTDPRPARLELVIGATEFASRFEWPSGTEQRQGKYQVLRQYGDRWELRLIVEGVDEPPVDLAIRFDDSDMINVKQLKGDDRLSSWTMKRQ